MSRERVNIAYTVELEEVLNEIKGMIDYVSFRIEDLNSKFSEEKPALSKKIENKELYNVYEFLNETRLDITSIDHRLADCARLIHGYNTYLVEQQKSEQSQPPGQPPPAESYDQNHQTDSPAGDLEEIQQRIASLKNAVEDIPADTANG